MKLENDTRVIGGTNMTKEEIIQQYRKMTARQMLFRSDVTDKSLEPEREFYERLIASGIAWERYPWLTGNWVDDKDRFIKELYNTYANTKD